MTLADAPARAPFAPFPGGQTNFMCDTTHKYVALCGGFGAGKSVVGAQKLAESHVHNCGWIPNIPFRPVPVRSLCIAQSYQMLQTVNVPQIVFAFETIGLECRPIMDPKKLMIVIPDLADSEILLRSADSPDKIAGFEVGFVWCDEASLYPWSKTEPLKDAVIQADGRLRDNRAKIMQMVFTYTPQGTGTRVFEDFEKGYWMDGDIRRQGSLDHVLYRAKTTDNPKMAAYAKRLREQYSPELAKQYVDGETMESNAGRVFSSFDSDNNIDPNLKLDHFVPLQLSVDFNVTMHSVIGQYFPTAGLPLVTSLYEISERNMTIPQMIVALKNLCATVDWNWTYPLEVYGDPAGHQRQGGRGESQWEVLIAHLRAQGIPFKLIVGRSHAAVSDRVAHANAALLNAEGRTRWKIHPRCRGLLEDLKYLAWKPDGQIDKRNEEMSHFAEADTNRIYQQIPIERITFPNTGRVFAV